MQSDYKIVGFNFTQMLLPLLAFSQLWDSLLSFKATTHRSLLKITWLRQNPALRNAKSQKAVERGILEFCNLWSDRVIKGSHSPSPQHSHLPTIKAIVNQR